MELDIEQRLTPNERQPKTEDTVKQKTNPIIIWSKANLCGIHNILKIWYAYTDPTSLKIKIICQKMFLDQVNLFFLVENCPIVERPTKSVMEKFKIKLNLPYRVFALLYYYE